MLTKEEFEELLRQKKKFKENKIIELGPDNKWQRDIDSIESKDTFILDFYKSTIELKKFTFNKRFRTAIVLIRYDSQGRHNNPEGTEHGGVTYDGPHLHVYREGYDTKIAFPVSEINIASHEETDVTSVLEQFLAYCNIEDIPPIQTSMM